MKKGENKILVFLTGLLFYLVFTTQSFSAAAHISWDSSNLNIDGSTITDLAGFRVYWKTALTDIYNLAQSQIVAICLSCPTPPPPPLKRESHCLNLPRGKTYFFVTSGFDTSGNENGFSNEVFKTMPLISNPLGNIDTLSVGSINRVDGFDLIKMSSKFGVKVVIDCSPSAVNWKDSNAEISDLNDDGRADGFDLIILSANFGKVG